VARVGQVATGDEKQISAELGAHLLRHMPEEWEVIPTSAPQPAASATAPARTGSAAPACKSAPPSRAAKAA
jgi:hypothetical protein